MYFRISVIEAGLCIKSHLSRYPSYSVGDAIRQLRAGFASHSTFDYESAQCLWQDFGPSIFCPAEQRVDELRETIFRMAVTLKPLWAKMSPFGRARVRAVLTVDQAQCLRYAGLLETTEEPVWRWWDKLAAHFRDIQRDDLLEIGRKGELYSLRVE